MADNLASFDFAHVIPQFNQVDPAAYTELAEAIDRVTPEPEGN